MAGRGVVAQGVFERGVPEPTRSLNIDFRIMKIVLRL